MKKILLTLFFFGCTSPAFAALTTAQWIAADASQARYLSALTVTDNIAPAMSAGVLNGYNTQIGNFLKDAVKLSRPVSATAEVVAPLAPVVGTSAGVGRIVARRALGLLGPVAVAVQIGMTVNDLYNMAKSDPVNYPQLNALTKVPVYPSPSTLVYSGNTYAFTTTMTVVWQCHGCSDKCPNPPQPEIPSAQITCDWSNYSGTQATGYSNIKRYQTNYQFLGPAVPEAWLAPFASSLDDPSTLKSDVKPTLMPEVDKAEKTALQTDIAIMMPPSAKIEDLANTVIAGDAKAASTAATATAVQTAQTNYLANPSPENKQKLDELLAQQATAIANQSKEDALIAPGLPDNIYDTTIIAPDKKSIPELLASFVASSPLVSMVRSFTMTTTGGSCSVPIGLIYGQQMSFDFCRWEPYLVVVGGLLILIMSGFSVLVVIRGW